MKKGTGLLFLALTSCILCLPAIPTLGCVAPSSTTFLAVSATGMTVDWFSFCSTATIQYSQVDDDPAFLSAFTLDTLSPPGVFGSTVPLIPNTLYYAQVSTSASLIGSVPLGSTHTLANLPGALPPSVISSTQLQSDWGASGNPAGTLYESQISDDGFATVWMTTPTTAVTTTWEGLTSNTSYYFRVRARNDDGVWTSFVSLGSVPTLSELPGIALIPYDNITVQGFRVHWTSGTVRWNPADTIYEVQIATGVSFDGNITTVSTTALQADMSGLLDDTLYYSRVRAFNREFVATAYTTLGSINTAQTPFTEGGSSTTVQSPDGSVTVIVTSGTFLEDYRVFLSTDPLRAPLGPPEIPSQIAEAETKLGESGEVARTPIPGSFAEIRAESTLGVPLDALAGNALTVTFVYPALDEETVDTGPGPLVRARTLSVYRLNETKSLWVRLPSSQVDTTAHTVTASAFGVGVFSLVGQQDTSLETAFAYPVPFRAKRGDTTVTFGDLSQRATIRIFSASGALVQTLEEGDGDGELEWDVKDSDGDPLPSGVYFYLIESSADKKRGKLVILR